MTGSIFASVDIKGLTVTAISAAHGIALSAWSGEANGLGGGGRNGVQLLMGYNQTNNYPHFICSQHYGGQAALNQVRIYTGDGTQAGVFPTNAILGLTVENGAIATGGTTPLWKLGAATTTTGLTLNTTVYITVTIDGVAYKLATVN